MAGTSSAVIMEQLGQKTTSMIPIYQKSTNQAAKLATDKAIAVMNQLAKDESVKQLHQKK